MPKTSTLVGLVLLLLAVGVRIPGELNEPELIGNLRARAFDSYQRYAPRPIRDDVRPVAIIDIDEKSLATVGQWPWSRIKVAELIDKLGQAGVAAIGLDIIFGEPDRLSPPLIARDMLQIDPALAERLAALPSNDTVMASVMQKHNVVVARANSNESTATARHLATVPSVAVRGVDANAWLFALPNADVVGNVPELEEAARGHGIINPSPDPDGVIRQVPTLLSLPGMRPMPALALEMLRTALGGSGYLVRGDAESNGALGIQDVVITGLKVPNLRNLIIPTDRFGRVTVHYTAPGAGRYISAADVLDGTAGPAQLAGKLVLVGTSAVGLRDIRLTPISANLPGVEVHANMLETILEATLFKDPNDTANKMLHRPLNAFLYEVLGLLIAGLVLVAVVQKAPWFISLPFTLLLLGGWVGVSLQQYLQQRVLVDATYAVIILSGLYLILTFSNYIRESLEKRQVRHAFGQYLSPALVEQLAQNPDQLKLGGETKVMTFLFCDVRGFTAISELFKGNPQGLTVLMNRLLTPLTDVILSRQGTIDKYMGDCIMAFWNAPLDDADHPAHACQAALRMFGALTILNAARKAEAEAAGSKYLPLNIGIGVNTGECVVGNMGSQQRFDYSVLGDPVNLASRLEGQSKNYGVGVVIGEDTAAIVGDRFALLELDLIAVKGKKEAVRIFTVLGEADRLNEPTFKAWAATHAAMLAAYRTQRWDEAEQAIADCRRYSAGEIDGLYDLYDERLAEFRANPPGADWDGVFRATSK